MFVSPPPPPPPLPPSIVRLISYRTFAKVSFPISVYFQYIKTHIRCTVVTVYRFLFYFFQWPATKLLFFRCKYYTIHTYICIPIMFMWVCVGVQLLFYTGRRWRKGRYKRNNKSVFSRRSPAAINNDIRSCPAVCDQIVQQVDNRAVEPISQMRYSWVVKPSAVIRE